VCVSKFDALELNGLKYLRTLCAGEVAGEVVVVGAQHALREFGEGAHVVTSVAGVCQIEGFGQMQNALPLFAAQ